MAEPTATTPEYRVRLQKRVGTGPDPDGGESFHTEVEKVVTLPFVPTTGITLGLEPDSDFSTDESRARRVMWLTGPREFLVELESLGYGSADDARDVLTDWLFPRGWRVALGGFPMDTEAEAVESFSGDPGIVLHARGKWWCVVTEDDVWALTAAGEPFTRIDLPGVPD